MVVGPITLHYSKFISVLHETNFVFILRFCNHPLFVLKSLRVESPVCYEPYMQCFMLWFLFLQKDAALFFLNKADEVTWCSSTDAPSLCSQVCWRVLWLCSLFTVSTLPVMMWLNSTPLTSTGKSYRVTVSGWLSFMPPGKLEVCGGTRICVTRRDL